MDPLQWMGAVRMRVQTADHNNPQVIHSTPVHQLTSCEVKSCVSVKKKKRVKIQVLYNIAFSGEKFASSESGQKYAQIKHHLHAKTAQSSSKQILWYSPNLFQWRNKLIYILDGLRVGTFYNLFFPWTISLIRTLSRTFMLITTEKNHFLPKQKYPLWVLILRFQKLFIYFFVPKRTFQWNVLTFFLSMKNLEKLFPL